MFTGGGAAGGIEKPIDDWSLMMIGNKWPESSAIASLKAVVDEYRAAYPQQIERVSELESARNVIRSSMVSEDFEVIHQRMSKLVTDRQAIAHGVDRLVFWGDLMIQECYGAQKEIVNICEDQKAVAWAFAEAGNQQMANVELYIGQGLIEEAVGKSVSMVESWQAQMLAAAPKITPAPWSTGSPSPQETQPGSSNSGIQEAGFGTTKEAGGQDAGHGQAGQKTDASAPAGSSQDSNGQAGQDSNQQQNSGQSHGAADGDKSDKGVSPGQQAPPKDGHGAASSSRQEAPPHAAPTPPSSLGSLPSTGGGGSGIGSPASGLGSLSGAGGIGGMGGMKPPPMEGLPPGGLSAPRPLLPPPGSPAGGAASGAGGGVPRIPPPQVPVSPVSAAPPVPPSPSAAAASSAGGFGANPAAVQPITPVQPAAATSGGVPSSTGAAPMAVAPMGGSGGGAAPPPAAVGPAPTASPGLSQGSIAPASAAAASSGASAAAAAPVVPAAMSEDAPAKSNQYGELAANTVRALVPGVALYKGLAVAVAVVQVDGGVQQLVFTTNEGVGFMPEGCYVPPGLIHAFADLGNREFNLKWQGWYDPARILIDYVVTRANQGDSIRLLGLASQVAVGPEVKTLFPQVIPSATPEPGAKPLEAKRNRHRLEVLDPGFYNRVKDAGEGARERALMRGLFATVLTKGGVLSADGGPWEALRAGRFTDETWGLLRTDYDRQVVAVGTMRGGFTQSSQPGGWSSRYRPAFEQLRAWECMLAVQDPRAMSVEDIIYTAHQAGVNVDAILDDGPDKVWGIGGN